MNTICLNLDMSNDYYMLEAFKTLRANVQFCGTDVKAITVTSCFINEGKSTVSLMLAKTLAEVGKKVLFVDADLRNSAIVKRYVEDAGILGLSQYLSGQCALEQTIYETQIEGLHAIFSGPFPANPSELLASTTFAALIKEQKERYDYVIVDTPPLGAVIDCAVIAGVCGSAILVVAADEVSFQKAREVKAQLEKSGTHILGVVLNQVKPKGNGGYGKYGRYGRYGRYGKYGKYGKYGVPYGYSADTAKKKKQ